MGEGLVKERNHKWREVAVTVFETDTTLGRLVQERRLQSNWQSRREGLPAERRSRLSRTGRRVIRPSLDDSSCKAAGSMSKTRSDASEKKGAQGKKWLNMKQQNYSDNSSETRNAAELSRH